MPKIFGWQHLLYLVIVLIVMISLLILIKRKVKQDKYIYLLIKLTGVLLLGAILWNRYSVSYYRDGFAFFLPNTFCGTSSLILSLSTIFCKKDSKILHCVAYLGLLGGILTLIYPDFIGQNESFLYSMTISGLIHHTIMTFLVILMLMTGYLKPQLKKWVILPLGLSLYMTYGLFLITMLGYKDAMYIYDPILLGTVLNWFVLGAIFLPVQAIFLFIWELLTKNNRL